MLRNYFTIALRNLLRNKAFSIINILGLSLGMTAFILVMIAIVIATPLSWYAMNQWLQDFAYRADISWWIFGSAGAIAIFIAAVTVNSQAIKAALTNPVDSLRSE